MAVWHIRCPLSLEMAHRTLVTRIAVFLAIVLLMGLSLRAQSSGSRAAERGWNALEDGDGEKAVAAFNEALAEHPQDPALHLGAGAAAHLLGRAAVARQFLRKALDLEPRLTPASVLLGQIAYDEGDVTVAIRTYEDALKHAPRNTALRERLDIWRNEANKTTYTNGPYSIMFEGHAEERLAAHATRVLDAAYWRIGKTIGSYPSTPIMVVLYTEQEFRDVTGAPEWSDGSFDTRIRIPVRGAMRTTARFDRVLSHELAHAMIASLAVRGVPAWLHEGLAVNLEPGDVDGAEERLKALRMFVPLAYLQNGFDNFNDMQAQVAYDVSTVAARALLARLGTRIGVLIGELGRGVEFAQAAGQLGVTASEFEESLSRRITQGSRSR
jgi:tetratricopeptide (TPR) repeat protein